MSDNSRIIEMKGNRKGNVQSAREPQAIFGRDYFKLSGNFEEDCS